MPNDDLEASAERIVDAIGRDMSYLYEEGERHFDPFTIAVGTIVLKWFLDAVRDAVGDLLAHGGETLGRRLIRRLKRFFDTEQAPAASEVVRSRDAARAAAEDAGAAAAEAARSLVTSALVDYLTERGLDAEDATRIAEVVRHEAQRTVGGS
jgi:hypothetical protein